MWRHDRIINEFIDDSIVSGKGLDIFKVAYHGIEDVFSFVADRDNDRDVSFCHDRRKRKVIYKHFRYKSDISQETDLKGVIKP